MFYSEKKRFNKQVINHRQAKFKAIKQVSLQHPIIGFIEALGILLVLALGALTSRQSEDASSDTMELSCLGKTLTIF